jgi:hypothetical protein
MVVIRVLFRFEWRGGSPRPRRNVRTKKEPIQPIPLFEELIALIMEVGVAPNLALSQS